ncbi:5455_t:CDS:2 [Entrophospora sp. SA101]|nr:5455_t:CDS:2 [Entrophospora sp. SA101]
MIIALLIVSEEQSDSGNELPELEEDSKNDTLCSGYDESIEN